MRMVPSVPIIVKIYLYSIYLKELNKVFVTLNGFLLKVGLPHDSECKVGILIHSVLLQYKVLHCSSGMLPYSYLVYKLHLLYAFFQVGAVAKQL